MLGILGVRRAVERKMRNGLYDAQPVVKLLSKRWWIPIGARLKGPKLEPERPRAEVGFLTADQGFSSILGTLFGFMAFKQCLTLATSIYTEHGQRQMTE